MTSGKAGSRRVPGRRFRPRTVGLAGGETLALDRDGTIEHRDRDGGIKRTWTLDDADWPRPAIRFGLHERPSTVTPSGRSVQGTKPPR